MEMVPVTLMDNLCRQLGQGRLVLLLLLLLDLNAMFNTISAGLLPHQRRSLWDSLEVIHIIFPGLGTEDSARREGAHITLWYAGFRKDQSSLLCCLTYIYTLSPSWNGVSVWVVTRTLMTPSCDCWWIASHLLPLQI